MKFKENWPRGFRGEVVQTRGRTDRRTTELKTYAQNEALKHDLVLGRMLLFVVVFELFPLHHETFRKVQVKYTYRTLDKWKEYYSLTSCRLQDPPNPHFVCH